MFLAIEKFDWDEIQKLLSKGWHIDYPVTSTGITLYMMLMGVNPEQFE